MQTNPTKAKLVRSTGTFTSAPFASLERLRVTKRNQEVFGLYQEAIASLNEAKRFMMRPEVRVSGGRLKWVSVNQGNKWMPFIQSGKVMLTDTEAKGEGFEALTVKQFIAKYRLV